jgi:hypothetical protein
MISNTKKMSIAVAITLLSLVLLTGCGGSGNADTESPAVATEVINKITVPLAPDPVANNSTVAGIDSNANGVRDDAERVVATASTPATAADNIQITIIRSKSINDPKKSMSVVKEEFCYRMKNKILLDYQLDQLITNQLTNTDARKAAATDAASNLEFGVSLNPSECE